MAENPLLAPAQFNKKVTVDPHGDTKFNRARFGGEPGKSKTMHNAGGHLPKPPDVHPHHRKAGKRSHRIK